MAQSATIESTREEVDEGASIEAEDSAAIERSGVESGVEFVLAAGESINLFSKPSSTCTHVELFSRKVER